MGNQCSPTSKHSERQYSGSTTKTGKKNTSNGYETWDTHRKTLQPPTNSISVRSPNQSTLKTRSRIERHHIGLLVIDSAGVGIEGDSNSADTYADFAKHLLNPLKKAGVTVLVLDNIGKDKSKGAIGSSRKAHESGATWQLTRNNGTWNLTATKRRTLGLEQAIAIKQLQDPLRYVLTTYAVVLDEQQQNIVLYLDTLSGAPMFTNRTLHDKLKEVGLSVKAERMDEAIRWWNHGNHSGIT